MNGRTLVTGATGHLGANLVRRLIADGEWVRVLLRPDKATSAVDGLDVERVVGDVRDADMVDKAIAGCDRVHHTAAIVSTVTGDARHRRAIVETNVLGTKHVLDAARRHAVRRVVVAGSFSAVGHAPVD